MRGCNSVGRVTVSHGFKSHHPHHEPYMANYLFPCKAWRCPFKNRQAEQDKKPNLTDRVRLLPLPCSVFVVYATLLAATSRF